MIQSGAKNRRRTPQVLRRTQYNYGVGGARLVATSVDDDR